MKNVFVVMIAVLLAVVFSAATVWAGPMDDGVTKMKSGMYVEAAEQFEIVIRGDKASGLQADSGNAEAHFLLGQCYTILDKMDQARERFGSALMIDGKYKLKIAKFCEEIGWKLFDGTAPFDRITSPFKKDERRADPIIALARHYDPIRAKTIGRAFFERGKRRPTDKHLFTSAVSYDPAISDEIGDFFWAKAGETRLNNEDQAYNWEKLAAEFNPRYKQTFAGKAKTNADRALETAKKEAKTPDTPGSSIHEDRRVFHKNEAIRFYNDAGEDGKAIVERELPKYCELEVGFIELGFFKKGEQTPCFLKPKVRRTSRIEPFSDSANSMLAIVFENGDTFKMWVKDEQKASSKYREGGSTKTNFKVLFYEDMHFAVKVE